MQTLQAMINPEQSTLLIAPNTYHSKLIDQLTANQKIIGNFQLMSMDALLKKLLSENDIHFDDDSNIVEKIKINERLIENQDPLKNNINYINELFKVKHEFFLSNLSTPQPIIDVFELPISFEKLDLSLIKTSIQHIIVYTTQGLYPIHLQLLDHLQSIGVQISYYDGMVEEPKYYFVEHKNTIHMVDYVIEDIYKKNDFSNTLIICDDSTLTEYFLSAFRKLNIPVDHNQAIKDPNIYKLISLFDIIEDKYDYSDKQIIERLFKKHEVTLSIDEIVQGVERFKQARDYHLYLAFIYHLLTVTHFFETEKLNDLFKDLYLIHARIDFGLLNQLLLKRLEAMLENMDESIDDALMIVTSKQTAIAYKHVYVIDASMPNFKQSKASYLLSTEQREKISPDLLSVYNFTDYFNQDKQRLLTCGENIYFNLALINTENKSKEEAFFIKDLKKEKLSSSFHHIFLSQPTLNASELLQGVTLDRESILKRLNNQVRISASALDTFGGCPYKYFVQNILKPSKLEEFSLMEVGSIYHGVLEQVEGMIIEGKLTYEKALEDPIVGEIIKKEITDALEKADQNNKLHLSDQKIETITRRMVENIQSTFNFLNYMDHQTRFHLKQVEEEINLEESDLIKQLQSQYFDNINFKGFIDAIFSDGHSEFILDYKTSKKEFKQSSFEAGIMNQLIFYMYFLKELNPLDVRGAFYKEISDNYLEVKSILDKEQLTLNKYKENGLNGIFIHDDIPKEYEAFDPALGDKDRTSVFSNVKFKHKPSSVMDTPKLVSNLSIFEGHVERLVQSIYEGEFPLLPYENKTCDFCDYKAVCHFFEGMDTRSELEKEAKKNQEQGGNLDV